MKITILFPTDGYRTREVSDVVKFQTEFGDENTITVWTGDGRTERFEGIGVGVTEAIDA